MKKLFKTLGLGLGVALTASTLTACGSDTLVVYTEAGFAPFEYTKSGKIQGVDVDIMNLVGEELGKEVVFKNVAFDTIIDVVAAGKLANVGAAGISVTEERAKKVNFSTEYYQANLYVIYNKDNGISSSVMSDSNTGVYWSDLSIEKPIGVQTGTTADFFLGDELAKGGSLEGGSAKYYDSLAVGVNAIGNSIDYVIIDELPAKKLCEGNSKLACLPLYYEGGEGDDDILACDSYAIAVTKGEDEILNAINKVLADLLKKDEDGETGIDKLVSKHLGV